MGDTGIAYVTKTWSPTRGCTPVSAGCRGCWATRDAIRRAKSGQQCHGLVRSTSSGPKWTGAVRFYPESLDVPLHWRASQRIAVCFGGDLFHPSVRLGWIDRILDVISATPRHTYLALTKRPELIGEKLYGVTPGYGCRALGGGDYLPNLWLGVSVEDQAAADARIPLLLQTPAALRWISAEPLLGAIDLDGLWSYPGSADGDTLARWPIHHVVIGGESGPGHREMSLDALRSLVEQCDAAGVPVYVKQDSGPRAGQQGRIPGGLWARKELPR